MNQPTEVFTGTVLGLSGVGVLIAIRLLPRRRVAPDNSGPVPTGFRYCPAEQRTRAAAVHADQSARCLDCGAHIPAGEATDA